MKHDWKTLSNGTLKCKVCGIFAGVETHSQNKYDGCTPLKRNDLAVTEVCCPRHKKTKMTEALPGLSYYCFRCEKEYYKSKGALLTRAEIIRAQKG